MCQNILQEEDDDIPVSDETTGNDADDTTAEQNGNISTKLASLSLDDTVKTEAAVNGNVIASEAKKSEITSTKKNKGKKGAANNNNSSSSNNNNNNTVADPLEGKDNADNELIGDSATVQV